MIFSKGSSYAIRALMYLVVNAREKPVLTSTIAEEESMPAPFLGKIMSQLALAGLVNSSRGPRGGYQLAVPADKIKMRHLIELFETQANARECLLGYKKCPGKKYCALHQRWREPEKQINLFLDNTTLADIAQDTYSHLHK